MKRIAAPWAVLAGCILVIATNAVLIAAAAWNRGERRATLALTEREIALPSYREEDSTALLLSLRMLQDVPEVVQRRAILLGQPLRRAHQAWFDEAKLRALGISVEDDSKLPGVRRVFLVLEMEGPAWERYIASRQDEVERIRRQVADGTAGPAELADAEALLAIDRTSRSRLVPVDAGADEAALRRAYADCTRCAIVPGLVAARVERGDDGTIQRRGSVVGLVAGTILVPKDLRPRFEPYLARESRAEALARERKQAAAGWPAPQPPRYRAEIAYGRRLEPWLIEAAPLRGSEAIASASPPLDIIANEAPRRKACVPRPPAPAWAATSVPRRAVPSSAAATHRVPPS